MITGCLQQKNGFYYAVLYLKVNGRRRCKWVPMRLPVEGTSARKAQKAFDEIRLQYEREEEERLEREAKAKELAENTHPDALLPFTEYMEKWLQSTRSSLATATYQSYSKMIKARIRPYFTPLGLQLREVTPQHIEEVYQSILADDCTTKDVYKRQPLHCPRRARGGVSPASPERRKRDVSKRIGTAFRLGARCV